MSVITDRLTISIRRIAKVRDDKSSGLGPAEPREPIPGAISTVIGPGGAGSGSGGGGGGTVSKSGFPNYGSSYGGTSGPSYSSTSGSSNPPRDIDDPNSMIEPEVEVDIGDFLDQLNGPALELQRTMSALKGMYDPQTNNEIKIRTGNQIHPTPEGWESPYDPPNSADPTWYLGYYYTSAASLEKRQTATDHVAIATQAYLDSGTYSNVEFLGYDPEIPPPPVVGFFIATMRFRLTILGSGSIVNAGLGLSRFTCSLADPNGPGDYCSIEPPLTGPPVTEWPEDGVVDILAGGAFFPSGFESDKLGVTQTTGRLKFTFGQGNRYGEAVQAADGGTIYYETTPQGVPFGNFKKVAPDGSYVATGPVSEVPGHLTFFGL